MTLLTNLSHPKAPSVMAVSIQPGTMELARMP